MIKESTIRKNEQATSPRKRVWPVFVSTLMVFVGVIITQLVAAIAVLSVTKDADLGLAESAEALPQTMMQAPYFTLSLVISGIPLATVAIVAGYFSAKNGQQSVATRLGLHRPRLPWFFWAMLLLGSAFIFHCAVALVWLIEQAIPGDRSMLSLYENISTPWALIFIAAVGIVPGVTEELFFRGFVQRRLLHRFSPAVAIGVTSFLFGLLHVDATWNRFGDRHGIVAWRDRLANWFDLAIHCLPYLRQQRLEYLSNRPFPLGLAGFPASLDWGDRRARSAARNPWGWPMSSTDAAEVACFGLSDDARLSNPDTP